MVSLIKCKMNPKWILRNFYLYAFGIYVPVWINQALTEKLSKVFTQILRFSIADYFRGAVTFRWLGPQPIYSCFHYSCLNPASWPDAFLPFLSPGGCPKKLSSVMQKAQSGRKINVKQTLCKPNQQKTARTTRKKNGGGQKWSLIILLLLF